MSCTFCGHDTPHGCWDAKEAASCGNYANLRDAAKSKRAAIDEVEKVIAAARPKPPTAAQIEKAERRELARLKAKYETRQRRPPCEAATSDAESTATHPPDDSHSLSSVDGHRTTAKLEARD